MTYNVSSGTLLTHSTRTTTNKGLHRDLHTAGRFLYADGSSVFCASDVAINLHTTYILHNPELSDAHSVVGLEHLMEVDGKPSMSMPPPVPTVHCCVCNPGMGDYPGGGGSSIRGDRVFVLCPV